LAEVFDLVAQGFDERGLVAWYVCVGRLVRLRRTIAQEHEHRTALFVGAQSAALYAAAHRSFGYAKPDGRLSNG
jgi:hypothetical protein